MATILELARHAGVSAENVLRVVHGEPVSSEVVDRVSEAIETLGAPPSTPTSVEVAATSAAVAGTRAQLLESLAKATAELEQTVPREVGSMVLEALRVEVRPVADRVASMSALVEQVVEAWKELRSDIGSERRERMEDLELIVDLITSGWRSVDRRLGRVERMLERFENGSHRPGTGKFRSW
jgi:hypothetical protein